MQESDKPKTFCVAPFSHMWYRNSGNYYVFKPCCEVRDNDVYYIDKNKNHKDNVIAEYWNSEWIKDIRKTMLENKPHKICTDCYKVEKTTGRKHRDDYAGYLKDNTIEFNVDTGNKWNTPLTLDYRPSNLCNLKCRMCGPGSSTEWAKEIERYKNSHYQNLDKMEDGTEVIMMSTDNAFMFDRETNADDQYKNLPLDNIRRAAFLGGEPLLNEEVFNIMSNWIKLGKDNIKIQITTNGTSFTDRWLKLFSKFKRIKLVISLDGVGNTFDYIRTNANWDKVLENCKNLSKLDHITICFSYCIQMYNVFGLVEILEFLKTWKQPKDDTHIFEVVFQNFLSTSMLDTEDYNKVISELQDYRNKNLDRTIEVDEILGILKYDRNRVVSDAEKKYFISYTNKLDEARKTSLIDLNQDFKKYLI
tara:strand:+ start:23768 stop:25021 length:1254 start_codon:yes stop_codon:yes gene_type:complete